MAPPESGHLQSKAYVGRRDCVDEDGTHVCDHIPAVQLKVCMFPLPHMITARRDSPYSWKEVLNGTKGVEECAKPGMISVGCG